jgi:glutamate---cysteine ligase / carboxylate-amine ligase
MPADVRLDYDERYLRARFDAVSSFTIGAEEELLLIDPLSGLPTPTADLVLELFRDDARIVTEFRASQLEIISPVCVCVSDVTRELATVRQSLAARIAPQALAVAVGVHPSAPDPGPLNVRPRYAEIAASQPWAARNMLTCGLHVHVAIGGADRALAVHNAMRSYLPLIVALGANAPFYGNADTGLATARPMLNRSLSRFGVPPAFASWAELSRFLQWGERSSTIPDITHLWWDMRLHPRTATLEIRAADVQTRVADTAAIVAVVQCLAYDLAGRHDAGDPLVVHERERIDEAMFVATRDGLAGLLPDLEHGDVAPAWERVLSLAERLRPAARELGCDSELDHVGRLVLEGGGSVRQRAIAIEEGIDGLLLQLSCETGASYDEWGAAPPATQLAGM